MQEEFRIQNEEQFNPKAKGRLDIKNPDMSFCSFILAQCMFGLSVYTFYTQRDFNNEYWSRQLIYNPLNSNPLQDKFPNAINFQDISNIQDTMNFLNTTIANQFFYPNGTDDDI